MVRDSKESLPRPELLGVATADYVIYRNDAGKVFAKSGINGEVIANGKDACAVIQQAIDALPDTGGKIYMAAGSYELGSTITIEDKHSVHLEGAARGIVWSGGMEGTVLRSEQDIDLLEIFGNKLKVAGITVSNLHLIGSGKENGKAGILVRGNSDILTLYNVGANHCGIGFYLQGGGGKGGGVVDAPSIYFCDPQVNGTGLRIEHCHYAKIIGGEFSDCDNYGIILSSPEAGYARIGGVKISSVTGVRNGKAGIFIGRNTEDITVSGGSDLGGTADGNGITISGEDTGRKPRNIIISNVHSYNNSNAGILVENARHVVIQGCICSVHPHVFVDNPGQKFGIHIKAASENVLVNGNITYGNGRKGVLDDTARATIANNS